MDKVFVALATAMTMTATFFYIFYILKGTSRPNISSWLIWIGLQALNTATYFDMSQDWFKSANALMNMLSTVSILGVALSRGRFSGLNKWDISVFGIVVAITLFWSQNHNSAQANMLLQVAVGVRFIPTIRGVWKNPALEKSAPWWFFTLGHLFSIAIVSMRWEGRYEELVFPILQVMLNLTVITAIWKTRMQEFIRYCLAGIIGVGGYYLLLYVLTDYVGWWYILSATIASVVNFLSNFLLQKFWTFKNRDRKKHEVKPYNISFCMPL
ncbi:MAG: hypothetical protein COT25_00610 [Candidatus Kerfeldbacteria bacterium CG08_land_8_20_14_0_20_42_7]|uniref:GtrA/DPMS transmembrane domain-containing protein n=1 Tax=Candidatus Kerfeldbacteria bacterium CG08_land_8_20_14_0_20_42_7 TaxID=2014245 RepID=A0A2H0YTX0_9BACT|nr:MAG: hypothetical protein COT25_00610 [Candidatus Kerfeldbacteria bacterium CG08_land_8_20_14_0_20_42_7]